MSIPAGGLEIPILLNSKVPNISHTERFRTSSLRYIYKNAEDKIPDEDNDDVDEKKKSNWRCQWNWEWGT